MQFERQSLSIKLILVVAILFVLLAGSFMVVSSISLNSAEEDIVEEVSDEIRQQIQRTVSSSAADSAGDISLLIERAYQYPDIVARQIASSISGMDQSLTRDQVAFMISDLLHKSGTSSMYAQFEANMFDGRDAKFIGGPAHSQQQTGSFEVYYVRNPDGSVTLEPIESAEEKYDTTLDEFGFRAAEWFLCAKENRKSCIINPYNYEIRPGYEELMTSLTTPVMAEGQFRGVVGVDLNLPILQKTANALKDTLYGGKAKVYVVSHDGFLAAATDAEDKLARPFKEVFPSNYERILGLSGKNESSIHDNYLYVTQPIVLDTPGVSWQLVVGVNVGAAMQPVDNVSEMISDNVTALLSQLLVVAIVATILALGLVKVFTSSIVKPVEMVADKMAELAGQGGDLTQELSVHSHAELIKLSESFNQFREKVRELLEQAKQSGFKVMEGSEHSREYAQRTNQNIRTQLDEIDSVVTAVTEMSQTAREVARSASEAARNADNANISVKNTESEVSKSTEHVSSLSSEMVKATEAVQAVSQRSSDIKKILDVIGAIAEQTNLLALNAAIEAARAGDHGRGFSVVADEVRALASKTADSVDEIARVIDALQGEVDGTVSIINDGAKRADSAAEISRTAFSKMRETVNQIDEIYQRVMQIAAAAEEQSQVSEELNKNMVVIGNATNEVAELANSSEQSAIDINKEIRHLEGLLSRLKTN